MSKVENFFDNPNKVKISDMLGVGYKSSTVNLLTWQKSTHHLVVHVFFVTGTRGYAQGELEGLIT